MSIAAASTTPPPPPMPSKIVEQNPISQMVAAAEADSGADAPAGSGCMTLEAVSKALLSDSAALNAVLARAARHSLDRRSHRRGTPAGARRQAPSAHPGRGSCGKSRRASLRSRTTAWTKRLQAPAHPHPCGPEDDVRRDRIGNWSWRQLLHQPAGLPGAPANLGSLQAIKIPQGWNIRARRNEAGTARLNGNLPGLEWD